MKKINVIIDTDPGVDDAVAIIPCLYQKKLNILLFTTVSGNVDVNQSTKNLLHILENYDKDIPVAKGAEKPLFREAKDAKFIHGVNGSGKYEIKAHPKKKPLKKDAVEAMYDVVCEHKKNITMVLIGPQTNMAKLLTKHPDVKEMISRIVFMGTSSYGQKKITPYIKNEYISFNSSSDPEALKITLQSGIPTTVVPSEIGRAAYLTASEVEKIKENKIVGSMLYEMLNGYWEPNVDEKIVAMNDTCALLCVTNKSLFKKRRAFIEVDTENEPGKTVYHFSRKGNVKIVTGMNFKKFHKLFFKNLNQIEKQTKNK